MKKITKLTERVSFKTAYKLCKKLAQLRQAYTIHRYFVYNDKHHWQIILCTIPQDGQIFYSGYSENTAQLSKYEAQSAHFNKCNYSLHCMVEHVNHEEHPILKSPHIFHHYFSNYVKLDYAFTTVAAERCLQHSLLRKTRRCKSGNCSTQYKFIL